MNKSQRVVAGFVAIAVLVGGSWAFGLFGGGEDPEVLELKKARETVFADRDQMSDADRRAARDNLRQRIDNLSEDQRQAFFRDGREQMMARMTERMESFFELSPEEQLRELDRRVDEIIERRQQGDQAERRRGGGQGGGPRRNLTEAQRDERSKRRLDRTNPQLRAQLSEYRRLLNERLQERGQPPMERRPGRGRF